MKVMFIEVLGDGGIAHYTYNLISALRKRRFSAVLATTRTYELEDLMHSGGVHRIFFGIAFRLMKCVPGLSRETALPTLFRRLLKVVEYPLNSIQCIRLAKRERVDLVHFQVIHLIDLLMMVLYKIAGFRVVLTVHNVMPVHKKLNDLQRIIYRFVYRYCDLFIIHSEVSKREFIELYLVPHDKIHVIPHGDYQFFVPEKPLSRNEAKIALGISQDDRAVLLFGAIRKNKGLEDILKAWPTIKRRIPKAVLVVAGEPLSDYSHYSSLMRSLNIQDSVKEFLRYISNEEVAKFFSASDMVVLPYREVSQSGVLQIAYAFGLPVVAASVGGFQEAVEEGKNGFLVPPMSVELLAERVVEVLSDREKAEAMGRHSLFLSRTRYSWEGIARKTEDVYRLLEV